MVGFLHSVVSFARRLVAVLLGCVCAGASFARQRGGGVAPPCRPRDVTDDNSPLHMLKPLRFSPIYATYLDNQASDGFLQSEHG